MKNDIHIGVPIAFIFTAIAIGLGVWIFKANMQAKVYSRQGVHMTTFEVMMGVKPIERVIQIKEN